MNVPLIVICAIALLLFLFLTLRVRLLLVANEQTARVELRVLCLRFTLHPKRPKTRLGDVKRAKRKAARKAAKKAKKAAKKDAQAPRRSSHLALLQGMTLREKIRTVRGLLALLVRYTRKYLRLHAARVHVSVATGDAATTAVAYGAVSQSLSYLLALLDRITRLKATTPQVAVRADFTGERSALDMRLVLSIRVWQLLATAVGILFALEKTKKRKKHTKSVQNKTKA